MGWCGYDIYDGDDTQTLHYDFLVLTKCAKNDDEIYTGEWLGDKTIIPDEKIPVFQANIDEVIKKMPKSKFWTEDSALEWQMLLALFVDNKLSVPKLIFEKGVEATEYLMTDDIIDSYTDPKERRRCLRRFINKAKKLKTIK